MVASLHHVNVTVPPELEAATKDFYGEVLGLPQLPKPSGSRPTGAWYQIGTAQLHLSVEDGSNNDLSGRHVCFAVENLAVAEQRCRDAGVEIIPDSRPVSESKRFFIRDPGGNRIEIAQQK